MNRDCWGRASDPGGGRHWRDVHGSGCPGHDDRPGSSGQGRHHRPPALARCARRAGTLGHHGLASRSVRARDDRCDQCHHRAIGRPDGPRHDQGLQGRPGDRQSEPPRHLQPCLPQASAVCPPASPARGEGADVVSRRGHRAGQRRRARCLRRSACSARRAGRGHLLAARLGQSGSRGGDCGGAHSAAARRIGPALASGQPPVARVRADKLGGAFRLRPAGRLRLSPHARNVPARDRRAWPAVRHAVKRRGLLVQPGGDGGHHPAGIRSGRGGRGRCGAGPPDRRRARSHPRHRRHHCQDSGYPGRAADGQQFAPHRQDPCLRWLSGADPDCRDRRDRSRWRLDRVGRRSRRTACRAPERWRGARSCLLWTRRHRADVDRCEPGRRPPGSRLFPRRSAAARYRTVPSEHSKLSGGRWVRTLRRWLAA